MNRRTNDPETEDKYWASLAAMREKTLEEAVIQGLKDAKAGRVYTHEEVFKLKRKKKVDAAMVKVSDRHTKSLKRLANKS